MYESISKFISIHPYILTIFLATLSIYYSFFRYPNLKLIVPIIFFLIVSIFLPVIFHNQHLSDPTNTIQHEIKYSSEPKKQTNLSLSTHPETDTFSTKLVKAAIILLSLYIFIPAISVIVGIIMNYFESDEK